MEEYKDPRGGARPNAGRKPKADEEKLIKLLDSHINEDEVMQRLYELIQKGDMKAITLYMNYKYGKPINKIETSGSMTLNEGLSLKDMIKFKNDKDVDD